LKERYKIVQLIVGNDKCLTVRGIKPTSSEAQPFETPSALAITSPLSYDISEVILHI
jgi:hypothetical protein